MEVRLPGHSHLLSPEMRAGGALFVLSQRVLPEHKLGVASKTLVFGLCSVLAEFHHTQLITMRRKGHFLLSAAKAT